MARPEHLEVLLLERGDLAAVYALLLQLRPTLVSSSAASVYRAVLDDGIDGRHLFVVVARVDGTVVGYSVVTWTWKVFKRAFVLRHPRAAVAILSSKVARIVRKRRRRGSRDRTAESMPAQGLRPSDATGPQWSDSSASIAKVLHTAVAPDWRQRGIGTALKAYYVDLLRQRGFHRVDAHIEASNVASIALNERSGWRVARDGAGVFAYLVLDEAGST